MHVPVPSKMHPNIIRRQTCLVRGRKRDAIYKELVVVIEPRVERLTKRDALSRDEVIVGLQSQG